MKTIAGGTWATAYGVGLAMLSEELHPGKVESFGLLMSVYGIGNIVSALTIGSMERKNSEMLTHTGLLWLGACFMGVSLMGSFGGVLVFTALSAVGGPWNDLPFIDLVQSKCSRREISQVFRIRNFLDSAFSFLFLSLSPLGFSVLGVRGTIFGCGGIMFLGAVWGIFARKHSAHHTGISDTL